MVKKKAIKVDYEIKANYGEKGNRPTSFEPKITVDGKPYELEKHLQKIYNSSDKLGDITNAVREKLPEAKTIAKASNEASIEAGISAATITCAASTVENVQDYIAGEITAEEMVIDILKDTGIAGASGYGTTFISKSVSQIMEKSSNTLLNSMSDAGVPAALVSFGVMSYHDIASYAQGEICAKELAYDLGEHAVSVASGVGVTKLVEVAANAVVPGSGTAVKVAVSGTKLVASMVGCTIATEAYCTAVDAGISGAGELLKQAQDLAKTSVEQAKVIVPEKASLIKDAITDYSKSINISLLN